MFTVIDGVLLKPLPYPEPDRLASLYEQTEKYGGEWGLAYLSFLDCEHESRSLAPMAAWHDAGGMVSEPGEAEYVAGRQVSASLFSVLGVAFLRGRAFLPGEDRPGGTPVAIVSYRLWQTRFGGDPGAIGARLVFDGKAYTVVGITPAGFQFSGDADLFTPLGQDTAPTMQNRDMHPGIHVVARLRPGVTLAQAQAELALIGRHLAEQYPKYNAGHNIGAKLLRQEIVGDVRPMLWLLLGAVSLVLLIACVNVASLLLALCGCALGVLLAAAGTRPFLIFWPGSLPRADEVQLDWRVLLFALAASLLSGLLFGLAPALRAPARELERALRGGARTVTGGSRGLHRGFVITEIAIAVVLLIAAGMLGRTLLRLLSLDPGMDPRNVLVTRVALSSDALASPARTRAAWREILDRVRQVPGVDAVAVADIIPMGGDSEQIGYWTTPAAPPANEMPMSLMNLVTPDYLRAMGIPLRQGRFFTEPDRIGNDLVVVIDEVLAKRAFGGRKAVGSRLWLQYLGPALVVGVAGHVRHWGLDADDRAKVREEVYLPFAQLPDPFLRLTSSAMSLTIRYRFRWTVRRSNAPRTITAAPQPTKKAPICL